MAAEPKTKPTKQSVSAFLKTIKDPERKKDAKTILKVPSTNSAALQHTASPALYTNRHRCYTKHNLLAP